jgi:hypothetical protein
LLIAKDVTRTSYTDTGLTYGTTYMYRVSAQNSLGYGDWSGAVSATFGGTFVPGVGIFRQNGEDLSYFSHKEVYSFINTNTWQESVIPQIRAVNVGGKVFVYRSGPDINVNVSDRVQTNTALGLADLQANPALALHYSDGSFASESAPWTDYVLGDVGNPDYQSLWVQRVIDDVRQAGADGVFIDNVLAHFTTLAQNQTKYSTEQQTHDAMLSFVKAVGPKLKAAGILAVGNVLGGLDPNNDIAFAGEVSPYLWGSLREYWEQVPPGVGSYPLEYFQDPSDWRGVFDLTLGWGDAVQNAGGNFFAIQEWNSNDDAASLYGRIAHMLVWNGGAGAFCWGLDYAGDPYSPAWTFNYGEPVAAREQIAAGVWKRAYEGGTVYLNATSSAVTIDGQSVAPHSAMHSP